jgi:hypothetical protein
MALTIAQRPSAINGCLQSWAESTAGYGVIRTQMEAPTQKVRRRTTAYVRVGDATLTIKGEQYDDFVAWYQVTSRTGTLPTWFKFPPDAREQLWRWNNEPTYEWLDNKAVRISFQLIQLPEYRGVTP